MNENDKGVNERIRLRVLEATDDESLSNIRQQLKEEGEKAGSIDAVVSELRKKGYRKFGGKSTAITKTLPVEAIVDQMVMPVGVDGAFIAGMKYEAFNIIRGIRLAQELSKMGIDQASPVIKMAQEMRESEAQAAKILAGEFAEATLEANKDLKGAIGQLGQQITASGANPMLGYMMPLIMPEIQKLMARFSGQLVPGTSQTGTGQQTPPPPEPTDAPPIEKHSIDEWEEE